ncbi:MAG: ATP-binding protein, partial [Oscillochloris sp.]|nr:ATP-binding protein [Oscillochloris sp.]
MNPDQLRSLLSKPEGATLDFKRKFYLLDDPNQQVKEKQRGEFIKDVLALANGNAVTAGETAYLIIGADDHLKADGTRDLFDVVAAIPDQRTLLAYVNSACEPTLDTIVWEPVILDGKRLIVITIPPTPHLHETARQLKTKESIYTEHIVLYRENAQTKVANARQREAILLLKRRRYADRNNAPPRLLGAVVGSLVGGVMGEQQGRLPLTGGRAARTIAGGLVGGLVGAGLGNSYRDLRRFWFDISIEP